MIATLSPADRDRIGLRIAHVLILGVFCGALAYFLSLFPIAWMPTAATWAFGLSTIVLSAKLLDERPTAASRRRRARVWASVHALVRDGVRMISCASGRATAAMSSASSPVVSPTDKDLPNDVLVDLPVVVKPAAPPSPSKQLVPPLPHECEARADELLGVLTSFPVALHHHIIGTRALPHPPLVDLLPPGYLASLKRTDARVRFAAAHAGPSGSGSPKPATKNGLANGSAPEKEVVSDDDSDTRPAKKSSLQAPYPANLPLSLLRLMEAYIHGLGAMPPERGGWTPVQTERALDVVKGLNVQLSAAEGIYAEPPPLIDVRLCLNIALFMLPFWLVTVVRGWIAVVLTLGLATWAKFGLDPILTEPDPASNTHPLRRTTLQMVHEALDTCPMLARYYRARLVARIGADSVEVHEHDRRNRRDRDEWLPSFG